MSKKGGYKVTHGLQLGQSHKLSQKASLAPVMTSQLQQAIKLLNLNAMELNEYIASAVQSNPLLEYRHGDNDGSDNDGSDNDGGDNESHSMHGRNESLDGHAPSVVGEVGEDKEGGDREIAHAAGSDSLGLGHVSNRQYQGRSRFESDYDIFDNLSEAPDLRSHLQGQIRLEITDESERLIADRLLDLLDDSGWVSDEWQGLAAALGVGEATVEAVLQKMQQFDPPGIFARNLKECLVLQLRERGEVSAAMEKFLDNLDSLVNSNNRQFCKAVGLGADEVQALLKEIQSLNPKPGSDWTAPPLQEITPDLILRVDHKGQSVLELNPLTYRHIYINRRYHPKNPQTRLRFSEDDNRYIAENYGAARWLIKSIRQRGETILRVGSEIVKMQKGFFDYGVSHLRPLILKDIANAVDMHESTVSRVINGKYIACERGVFELKNFFTVALSSRQGESVISAMAVRQRIQALVDGEAADGILSDSDIADILVEEGIDIARRTVAKYREAMGIDSSVDRRKLKNSALAKV